MGYGFVFKNWWLLAAGVLVAFFGLNGWAIEPCRPKTRTPHWQPTAEEVH